MKSPIKSSLIVTVCLLFGSQLSLYSQTNKTIPSKQSDQSNEKVPVQKPMRDPFSAANREMGLPIYSATPAQTKNPIFKDLIKTQVLVLAENEVGERLAFIKLPMGEVLSVKEDDSFSIQSSDLSINTVEVVKISDISMRVRVDRSEMILR
mgnify:FL=1